MAASSSQTAKAAGSSRDLTKITSAKFNNVAHYEAASAALLSMQPSDLPVKAERATPDWGTLKSHLEQRLVMMRNWRQSWWTQNWSDLAEFILPRRSIWLTQSTGGTPSPNNMTRGRPINQAIVDPTGTYAMRVCAGGLMSGLASPSRPWFQILPSLRGAVVDAAGRAWLDDVEDRIYTVLAGSNFYNSFAQECEDLVVFGTSLVILYEDARDLIRLYNPAVGEYYLSSSATMRIDSPYRQFVMTVSQIVDFFGVENCPPDVVSLWNQKGAGLEKERIIAHAIEPNYGIGPNGAGKLPGNFAWREVYWVWGASSDRPLSIRGFVDQPFTASRWATQSNDAYGRSVGMDVLPDVMQLQVETRRKAEAIEKQVRPPLIADVQLKNQPSSILPGHVTYVANLGAGTGMRPIYTVEPNIKAMMLDIEQIQARIKTGFFNDLFLMLQAPVDRQTAYEVAQKMQEKLQVIGPVIEGLLNESLKPKLRSVFNILKRKGMIPPPPDSLKGQPLGIEFVSMLVLAAKAAATGGIERLVSFVGNMAPVFPGVTDNLDPDETVREMNMLLGNPSKIIRGADMVASMRQQQQAQQQKEQQMNEAQHMAKTAGIGADAAQVMANTQVGAGQTALSAVLGQ